jgi:hypothetical protein
MTFHVRSGGSWRTIDDPQVRVSGTWQEIDEGWVKVSGTWQQFYTREALALPGLISSTGLDVSTPYDARAAVKVDTDGYMYRLVSGSFSQVSGSDYWINDKAATKSNYECKMTGTGTTPNDYGLSLNTWYTLSSDRTWGLIRTSSGSESFSGTLYIREIADTGNQVTCSITLEVEAGFA